MPVFERIINLNVEGKTVLRYLSEPTHFPELCPNIIEIRDLQRHMPDITQFEWTFKLVGVRFEGAAELTFTHHNQQMDVHFWGGIRGNLTWRLQPSEEGITLALRADYILPAPLLKKHDEETILRQNADAVEFMLSRLRTVLEGSGDVVVKQK